MQLEALCYLNQIRALYNDGRYSDAFADWYLLPMAAAIWSCPTGQMRDMPLATFIRFCQNHGLLQVFDRPMWRTVQGGGREYVKKIAAQLDDIRLACPVRAVTRAADGLTVAHGGNPKIVGKNMLDLKDADGKHRVGEAIKDARELSRKIATFAPGTKATITLFREGKSRDVTFEVGRQPAA